MTDRMELYICRQLVERQLNMLESITKDLKEINKIAETKLNTFDLEMSIVHLQEEVESFQKEENKCKNTKQEK